MNTEWYSVLKHIESRDPDGGPTQPTEEDYAAHEAWAVKLYGQEAWNAYLKGGWDDQPFD